MAASYYFSQPFRDLMLSHFIATGKNDATISLRVASGIPRTFEVGSNYIWEEYKKKEEMKYDISSPALSIP